MPRNMICSKKMIDKMVREEYLRQDLIYILIDFKKSRVNLVDTMEKIVKAVDANKELIISKIK